MLRKSPSPLGHALYDDPIQKAKKAEAARRADPNNPRNRILLKYAGREQALKEGYVSAAKKMSDVHAVERSHEQSMAIRGPIFGKHRH